MAVCLTCHSFTPFSRKCWAQEHHWRRDMSFLQRNPRFFASTRGKIVTLLRRTSRTVEELAQALDLTDNAVRAQLATLERDGLVHQHGRRRSSSKPASVYDLTPAAEELFSKAYGPVLRQLLDELNERMTAEEVEALLHATGRRFVAQWPIRAESCMRGSKRRSPFSMHSVA